MLITGDNRSEWRPTKRASLTMDTASMLGVNLLPQRPQTQEDFDNRYNFTAHKKKKPRKQCVKRVFVEENWRSYRGVSDVIPLLKWASKLGKEDIVRDVFGSVLLLAIALPQAAAAGLLVHDIRSGLYSYVISQFLYSILASARHSSLGTLSMSPLLVASSLKYNNTSFSTLTLTCAVIQLLLFILPLDVIFEFVSPHVLLGFNTGLFIRLFLSQSSDLLIFDNTLCSATCNGTWFNTASQCVRSVDLSVLTLSFFTTILLSFMRWQRNPIMKNRITRSLPWPFLIIIIATFVSLMIPMPSSQRVHVAQGLPEVGISLEFSSAYIFDALSIVLFSTSSHLRITKHIAMEKMHRIQRKQEILSFCIISFVSAPFSLLPPASSQGNSIVNSEVAKYSILGSVLSAVWLSLLLPFTWLIEFVPKCVLSCSAIVALCSLSHDVKEIRRLFHSSEFETVVVILSVLCPLFVNNFNSAFLLAIMLSLSCVLSRVLWPTTTVMVKVADHVYAEEERYEADCLDTPLRIVRISTSQLLWLNAPAIRRKLQMEAVVVKGLIGIGIGTRTASLRSQGPVGPKESFAGRSSVNLTNIIINVDSVVPTSVEPALLRFIILDCSGVSVIDTEAVHMLTQVSAEFQSENIKLFFAAVPAEIRDFLEKNGFFSLVSRTHVFPTLHDAMCAARLMTLPIHLSISMNGYRDVITLSTATSNQEISRVSPEAV